MPRPSTGCGDLLWNALGCVAIGVCGSSLKKLFLGYGYIE
jgi:hypothetical protein